MQTGTHSANLRFMLLGLFILLFVVFMYTFLHETGHALVGLLAGQSLTELDVSFWNLNAHVSMTGGDATRSQLAMQAVAGASLPLLVWLVFVSLMPRTTNPLIEALKWVSSLVVLNTLLAWIALPVLYLFGKAPASDDVTHLLLQSQMQPVLLAVTALILYAGGWVYFLSKTNGVRNELLSLRAGALETFMLGQGRRISAGMISLLVLCVLAVVAINAVAARNPLNKLSPPPDFAPVAEIDLSKRAYSSEVLAEFSVEQPTYVGIFIVVHEIDTTYFDLSVRGPDGYRSIVLHGEGYRADQDGGLWEANLPPGNYQVVLNADQRPGTVSVFLRTH